MRVSLFVSGIEAFKKVIKGTSVYLFELDQHADPYVQLARLVFGVAAAGNIAPAQLELGAELFLRDPVSVTERAEIVSDAAVTAKLLFHFHSTFPFF